jgi:hypothetical protein
MSPSRNKEQSREHLDQWISKRNRRSTLSAFSPQEEKTENREIIVPDNGALTGDTPAPRRDDGLTVREATNDDIQKAPGHQTE